MAAKSLQELFVEELRDIYDGEKRLTKALPKMAKAASSPDLQIAFTTHLEETQGHIGRIEQVFDLLGEKARGKKCDGIAGIVAEGARAMQELEGAVLDAALIAGAQKVEHYEIASYGTLAYFADMLENTRAKDLLGETLQEERATDEKLSALAKGDVNRRALIAAGTEERVSRHLSSLSSGVAHDRPSRSRSSGSRRSPSRSSRRRSRGSRG